MTTASYEVHITDPFGTTVSVVPYFERLSLVHRYHEPGWMEVDLPPDFNFSSVRIDGRMLVYRNGRLQAHKPFLIRRPRRWRDGRGVERLTLAGPSAVELLTRRHVGSPPGSPPAEKSGPADNVIKQYCREGLGTLTAGNRDISQWLLIRPNTGEGPSVVHSGAWRNLLQVCKAIADETMTKEPIIFFDIVQERQQMEFRTYAGFPGTNRIGQGPLFSDEPGGNLHQAQLEWDHTEEHTMSWVLGQGEGGDQLLRTAEDFHRSDLTPIGRREIVQHAQIADVNQLLDEARRVVSAGLPRIRVRGEVVDTEAVQYGRDWNMGDVVIVRAFGREVRTLIEGVSITVQNGREIITPIMDPMVLGVDLSLFIGAGRRFDSASGGGQQSLGWRLMEAIIRWWFGG